MNKDAILKTAMWRKEEGQFVVLSPLSEGLAGTGKTKEEAAAQFRSVVQDRWIAYLEGRLVGSKGSVGRPKKCAVEFHTQVNPEVKKDIVALAQDLGLSQGDIVEFLYRCYLASKDQVALPQTLVTAQQQS
jgi:hypothetical protein